MEKLLLFRFWMYLCTHIVWMRLFNILMIRYKNKSTHLVTANAEIIMMCQDDAEYKNILTNVADLVLPDGAGTVWAGRQLGYAVPERVAGF